MEARAAAMDEALRVLDSALSHVQWRLKSSSKRRLEIDIIALCTGMRPVVMVDYGGKLPELQRHLCSLLRFCQKGSPIFEHLRVMLIQDMIYLIHKGGLAEHVRSSLSLEAKFLFVDLEQDPPAIIRQTEEKLVGVQLVSVQQLFSLHFPLEEQKISGLSCNHMTSRSNNKPLVHKPTASGMSEFIDLSSCMQDTKLSIPTLNGWLLGYPVVYMFSTDHIEDAIYNLSTKSLQIFRVLVCRNRNSSKNSQEEELMSFSVPYDLSMGGKNEPWAETFLSHMHEKWGRCKYAWNALHMEVSECYPQAIVL